MLSRSFRVFESFMLGGKAGVVYKLDPEQVDHNGPRMGMPGMAMPMIPGMALPQSKPAESTPKAAA